MTPFVIFLCTVAGSILVYIFFKFTKNTVQKKQNFNPLNKVIIEPFNLIFKHCYITGGSQGLGKSLAIFLASLGADVTIVARGHQELERAAKEIKANSIKQNNN